MASIEENISHWSRGDSWKNRGDEWSAEWGSPRNQWNVTVLPRIRDFLPVETILEIAPGFGRWTEFLRHECDQLIGVDLNENCVQACRQRFADDPKVSFWQNDGVSLAFVADASVDLVFSFDSLVHGERDVIKGYLAQFARILKPNGAAFIHHSNYGSYVIGKPVSVLKRIPKVRDMSWQDRFLPPNPHWRAHSVSAVTVRKWCAGYDLRCIRTETIAWGGSVLNDCFSTIVKTGSKLKDQGVLVNREFMEETKLG